VSLLNSEDRTMPFTCWLSFLNSSALGEIGIVDHFCAGLGQGFQGRLKETMIGEVASMLNVLRGTPVVTPAISAPLQKATKSGICSNGMSYVLSSWSLRLAMLLSRCAASLTVRVSA